MTNAIPVHLCDGYKMPSAGLLASLSRYTDPNRRYVYTVRDGDTDTGVIDTDDKSGPSDLDTLEKTEDAPVFPLKACGDLQWFPEFASLFGDN